MPPFSTGFGVIVPKIYVKSLKKRVGSREDESSIASGGTGGFPKYGRGTGRVSAGYYSLCSYAEAHKTAGCSYLLGAKSARLLVGVAVML